MEQRGNLSSLTTTNRVKKNCVTVSPGSRWLRRLLSGFLLLCALPATAGSWSFDLDTSISGEGSGRVDERKGVHMGSFSEIHTSADGVATWNISDTFDLRAGAGWERYSFMGMSDNTAIPATLQSVHLLAGFDYQVTPSILLHLDVKPGFYGDLAHISTKDFDVPIEFGGAYFVSTDFQIVAGIGVDLFRNNPAIPFIGARWQVNDHWLIDGTLPKPQVVYKISDAISLYVGGEFLDSAYRMTSTFGTRNRNAKLDNSILTYEEVHVGAGIKWKVNKELTVDLDTGCVPYRKFDYDRASYSLKSTDPVPYGELSLSFKF